MRLATESEVAHWDELVAANPDGGCPRQSYAWGELKSHWGWRPRRYVYELIGGKRVAAQWLVRRVPLLGEYWYCPGGPGVVAFGDLRQVVEQTKAAHLGAAWFRFEAPMPAAGVPESDLAGLEIVRSSVDVEPRRELRLRLAEYDFPDKAAKIGLMVKAAPATDENLMVMHNLVSSSLPAEAAAKLRPREYYLEQWSSAAARRRGVLFLVRYGGGMVGGAFVSVIGRRAWSTDMVVAEHSPGKRPGLLVQCEVMRWLQQRNIESYGLPLDLAADFGQEPVESIGAWDLPMAVYQYRAWRWLGERLAGLWASRRPEKSYY